MGHPSADRLIGDGDPALSEEVLDIPEAECELQIQPDGVLKVTGRNLQGQAHHAKIMETDWNLRLDLDVVQPNAQRQSG